MQGFSISTLFNEKWQTYYNMSDFAIKVENVSKKYELGVIGAGTLYHTMWGYLDKLKRGGNKSIAQEKEFWALKDVNFEIKKGEVMGIIGHNGAGKSTLLKVLSRITEPTTGRITIKGRVASLLEVGTGFHPELSGRENIFLNGSILGMSKQEIKSKFDEIVEFSGVEKFLDTPVKRYSSGMYVRLAFAVAAHLEPEILVIDEVLSVGDAEFQKKCLGKMGELSGGGRTVVFVSHNMGAVRDLCNSCIVMNHGQITYSGNVNDGIDNYLSNTSVSATGKQEWNIETAPGNEAFKLVEANLKNEQEKIVGVFKSTEEIKLTVIYKLEKPLYNMRINLRIQSSEGHVIFSSSSHQQEIVDKKTGTYQCSTTFPRNIFNQNIYLINIQVGQPGVGQILRSTTVLEFNVEKISLSGSSNNHILPGFVAPILDWSVEKI